MRLFIITSIILVLVSCKERNKNIYENAKNFYPISIDSSCINPSSDAYFELKTKNFDSVVLAVKTKLSSVLGTKTFDEIQSKIMADSIKKAVFNLDSAFIFGDIQIDITNLLSLKNDLSHYMSNILTPRRISNWENNFTQFEQFTFQKTSNFEIGYIITPCIKKILKQEGQFKRQRKGNSLPKFSKESNAYIDRINIYDCIMNISIILSVDDKSGLTNTKRQFYEIKITDTAKVFTTIDILTQK